MSNRERVLTNAAAERKTKDELLDILLAVFGETEGRPPSAAEHEGLHEAAAWVTEKSITWSQAEGGLRDGTWDPAKGPRALMSEP